MKNNITFIGMPGSGKSSYGKAVSKKLNLNFVDGDDLIRNEINMPLNDYIKKEGTEKFMNVENDVHANLNCKNTVIAPGGSICYCEDAMNHLKEISKIVYLKISNEEIHNRVPDPVKRGVVMKEGETFDDVYKERTPLYEKYADIIIEASDDNYQNIMNDIITKLDN